MYLMPVVVHLTAINSHKFFSYVLQSCVEFLGQKSTTSIKVKETVPAMHGVTLVDIDSEANGGDTDQETDI